MMSDQQCSPVVRYWMSFFRRAEMEVKLKDVTRSTRFSGFNRRKGDVEAFSGVQMKRGRCCDIFWRSGFNQRRVYAEAFSGVQMEIELKIISRMRSLGLSSVHVSP